MSENKKMNSEELKNVAGGNDEKIKVKIPADMWMGVDIPGLDQNPRYKCRCLKCGHEFWFRQPGINGSYAAIQTTCPKCGSTNVSHIK